MRTFVHGHEQDIWHWCKNCPDYPTDISASQKLPETAPPSTGVLCSQCEDMVRDGGCEADEA